MDTGYHYDLLLLANCRDGRARAEDLAEEIRAQASGGYSTGLIDLGRRKQAPFDPILRRCVREGLADLLPWNDEVRARAIIVHSPVAAASRPLPPRIYADQLVVIIEDPTPDHADPRDPRDLVSMATTLAEGAGLPSPSFAPRGPIARAAIERAGFTAHETWSPVLDVPAFTFPRGSTRRPPVLGRLAPAHPRGWPGNRETLLAVYPDDDGIDVRILGDATGALQILGTPPRNWTVFPAGSRWRSDLLAAIDAYACYPDPGQQLSPGRGLLEAIASGAVALGPPGYRAVLGEAILAVEAQDVQARLEKVTADPEGLRARSQAARELLLSGFDRTVHRARIDRLIGPPSTAPRAPLSRRQPWKRRVLFISSNGAGVGHLMRLMSIARRMGQDVQPVFLTLSQAVAAVHTMGFPVEYLPSHLYARLPGSIWHPFLRRRMVRLLDLYRPNAVVFDGTAPYRGLTQAMERRRDIPFVWSRRAMWKPGLGERALERAADFDLVVEPGDFAEERDRGATVRLRDSVTRTLPILLHDPDEMLPTEQARAALEIEAERPAVLVQLGAGNINDIASTVGIVVRALAAHPDLQICVSASIIGAHGTPALEHVKSISVYPLARYLRAFDFAVSASGYNTYHELISAGIPTIFIPNLDTALDDQAARASHAATAGVGLALHHVDEASFAGCLQTMLDPSKRASMAARCAELFPGNGALAAAQAIRSLSESWERHAPALRAGAPHPWSVERPGEVRMISKPAITTRLLARYAPRVRRSFRRRARLARLVLAGDERAAERAVLTPVSPGPEIDPVGAASLPVAMILCWQQTEASLASIVDRVAQVQRSRRSFKPLFVTDSDAFGAFRNHGYLFEFVMPQALWDSMDHPLTWADYRARRLTWMLREYGPEIVLTVRTPDDVEPGLLDTVIEPAI